MARDFDGTDDYCVRSDQAELDITSAITISCWVNPDTLNTTDFRILVAKGARTGNPLNYQLDLREGSSNGNARVNLTWHNSSFRAIKTTSQTAVTTGSWQHVAAGYDGTTKKIWVGGSSLSLTDTSGNTALVANSSALEFGRRDGGPAAEHFDGKMAEVAVWTAVLSDDDAATLAKGVSPLLVRPASLLAYWPLFGEDSTEPEPRRGMEVQVTGPVASAHPRVYRGAPATFLPFGGVAAFDPSLYPWASDVRPRRSRPQAAPF